MSNAEFEEKEFEGPLNGQLCLGAPMWTPGQVLEKIVGFDASMMVQDVTFWSLRGFGVVPPGAIIQRGWWSSALAHLAFEILRRPPNYRQNVFLQYKRPEYLSSSAASEWSTWKGPYFRFRMVSHQQKALEACAAALGSAGLVAYGSPAFYGRADLFHHVEHGTLVQHTHFAPAASLHGHARYTYQTAQGPGFAHSEPVRVFPHRFVEASVGPDGVGQPPNGRDGGSSSDGGGRRPDDVFSDAAGAARAAVAASPSTVGGADAFARSERLARAAVVSARRAFQQPDADAQSVGDFVTAMTFTVMAGLDWLVR